MPEPVKRLSPLVVFYVVAAIILVLVVIGANIDDGSQQRSSEMKAIDACVDRGAAYFREIGSYSTLSDGRDAVLVASERCRRSTMASSAVILFP